MEAFWLPQRSACSPEEARRAGGCQPILVSMSDEARDQGLGDSKAHRGTWYWQRVTLSLCSAALQHELPQGRTILVVPEDEEQMC